ncbi:ketopantoate reductase family protein [Pseudonocardia dioxanivorans]|uniref:ketopantoate reductase family protein n=1 Tax=Pseudonocardia dioxanivorans TaxID=240495 RepID=UPI001F4137B4|nr:2-dehydropantoate 2-reductase N-terminal domain-containing protein [Pseudonocardia dioxanivorans]
MVVPARLMRYVIVGAGAIGGTVGGLLHQAGNDVVLVARGAHLDALRRDGLTLDRPSGTTTLRVPVAGTLAEAGLRDGDDPDLLVVATKLQDAEPVLDQARELAPGVGVLCAQNGVAGERMARARFETVVAMVVILMADHLEPGVVAAYMEPHPGVLDVGGYPEGDPAAATLAGRVAADLVAAGFSAQARADIMRWKYRKLLSNLGNAAEAACGSDDPALADLSGAARVEGVRALAVAGIDVATDEEDRARRNGRVAAGTIAGRTRGGGSSWQSLRRGTGSIEASYLNGEIIALGERHGVATPVNSLLLRVAEEMAAAREQPGGRSAADLLAAAT